MTGGLGSSTIPKDRRKPGTGSSSSRPNSSKGMGSAPFHLKQRGDAVPSGRKNTPVVAAPLPVNLPSIRREHQTRREPTASASSETNSAYNANDLDSKSKASSPSTTSTPWSAVVTMTSSVAVDTSWSANTTFAKAMSPTSATVAPAALRSVHEVAKEDATSFHKNLIDNTKESKETKTTKTSLSLTLSATSSAKQGEVNWAMFEDDGADMDFSLAAFEDDIPAEIKAQAARLTSHSNTTSHPHRSSSSSAAAATTAAIKKPPPPSTNPWQKNAKPSAPASTTTATVAPSSSSAATLNPSTPPVAHVIQDRTSLGGGRSAVDRDVLEHHHEIMHEASEKARVRRQEDEKLWEASRRRALRKAEELEHKKPAEPETYFTILKRPSPPPQPVAVRSSRDLKSSIEKQDHESGKVLDAKVIGTPVQSGKTKPQRKAAFRTTAEPALGVPQTLGVYVSRGSSDSEEETVIPSMIPQTADALVSMINAMTQEMVAVLHTSLSKEEPLPHAQSKTVVKPSPVKTEKQVVVAPTEKAETTEKAEKKIMPEYDPRLAKKDKEPSTERANGSSCSDQRKPSGKTKKEHTRQFKKEAEVPLKSAEVVADGEESRWSKLKEELQKPQQDRTGRHRDRRRRGHGRKRELLSKE